MIKMKATRKLSLNEIKVESFVTNISPNQKRTIQGGGIQEGIDYITTIFTNNPQICQNTSSPNNLICGATTQGTSSAMPPTTETASTIQMTIEVGNLTLTAQQSRDMGTACGGGTMFHCSFGNGCDSGVADPNC